MNMKKSRTVLLNYFKLLTNYFVCWKIFDDFLILNNALKYQLTYGDECFDPDVPAVRS